ncbi:MAG: ASCH domain-containing protein [Planctomycetota bacterium]|jgi:ASC-1-like (ASCH) protein
MVKYHLAILKKKYFDLILNGRKSVEMRLTKGKCPPFGQIGSGDRILLKVSSGPVAATATVSKVKEFSNLTPEKVNELQVRYNGQIGGDELFWQSKEDCRFAVLVWLRDIRKIEPVMIDKKDWRAWVVLNERQHYGLLEP